MLSHNTVIVLAQYMQSVSIARSCMIRRFISGLHMNTYIIYT